MFGILMKTKNSLGDLFGLQIWRKDMVKEVHINWKGYTRSKRFSETPKLIQNSQSCNTIKYLLGQANMIIISLNYLHYLIYFFVFHPSVPCSYQKTQL